MGTQQTMALISFFSNLASVVEAATPLPPGGRLNISTDDVGYINQPGVNLHSGLEPITYTFLNVSTSDPARSTESVIVIAEVTGPDLGAVSFIPLAGRNAGSELLRWAGPGEYAANIREPPFSVVIARERESRHHWQVTDGNCVVLDDGACIASPNYPGGFAVNDDCHFLAPVGQKIHVVEMEMFQYDRKGRYYAKIWINGNACQDKGCLEGQIPTSGLMSFHPFDLQNKGGKWKLCGEGADPEVYGDVKLTYLPVGPGHKCSSSIRLRSSSGFLTDGSGSGKVCFGPLIQASNPVVGTCIRFSNGKLPARA